jgi:3-methyladenine DNA glycosylase AlkD
MSGLDENQVLAWLERRGSARNRAGMARYGIQTAKSFGVSSATMRPLAKRIGRDHDLALALWDTGWLEARMLAGLAADPARLTPALMDRWCRDFDNWAICDSTCLHLFSRTPHAWRKVTIWSGRRDQWVRRAGFALLAALAIHDRRATDAAFVRALTLVEAGARDERNFVKKAVNWALRQIGKRSLALNLRAIALAHDLAASPAPTPRWIGKDALRELTSPAVARRLARRPGRRTPSERPRR